MTDEYFGMDKKGHRIYHDGNIQIWKIYDTDNFAFYSCFIEKDRVGKYLFYLTEIGVMRLIDSLSQQLRYM